MHPIYAEIKNKELSESLDRVDKLIREIEKETAFLATKRPMLCAVPAPSDDCVQIGGVVVCGVSALTELQRAELVQLLESFILVNHEPKCFGDGQGELVQAV